MKTRKWLLVLAMLCVSVGAVQGAVVQDIGGGWEVLIPDIYADVMSAQTVTVINDKVVGDTVIIELLKDFGSKIFKFDVGDPIYVQFRVAERDHVPNIVIRDEHVTNNTGVAWTDFHIILAQPLGTVAYVGFDEGPIFEPVAGSQPFATVGFSDYQGLDVGAAAPMPLPMRIDFNDGTLADGDTMHPGIGGTANNYAMIVTNMLEGDVFTLKEIPTIPEPLTMLLLGAGGVVLLRRRVS